MPCSYFHLGQSYGPRELEIVDQKMPKTEPTFQTATLEIDNFGLKSKNFVGNPTKKFNILPKIVVNSSRKAMVSPVLSTYGMARN